jgi:predicted dienelactone hydrolase
MRQVWILACTGLLACNDGGGPSTDSPGDFVKGALTRCLADSGDVTARCVNDYAAAIAACRVESDEICEPQARESGGALDQVIAATLRDNASTCDDEQAFTLGYFGGGEDLADKSVGACGRFGEELLSLAFSEQDDSMSAELRACQRTLWDAVTELHAGVVHATGPECAVLDFDRDGCDRVRRDDAIAAATERARSTIVEACGDTFDSLRLAAFGPSLADRVRSLMDVVVDRGRNLAIFAYPPNNIGATAEFGSFPIGIRTFEAVDESRLNVLGDGPRPVTFDVYYPSTAEAVEGLPRDIVSVLGIEILPAPAYRDVDVSEGVYPLVLFSHGFEGVRFQSFFHVAHLASHGFIVVSPDHHGNTIPDTFAGIVDKSTAVNRAFDVKFVMDQILDDQTDPGTEFAASIDSDRIGMSGHSFGGYESFILTGGEVQGSSLDETTITLGTFTDPRIRAILPMAPRTMRRVDAVTLEDDYFRTVVVPTLIIGSELDMTDPFFVDAKRAFDNLPIGAEFVGLAEVLRGGHNTFTDLCELQPNVLDVVGGANEGCMPRHLPWKHAHDLINYLALNFFDGVLNGNDEALERLTPEVVGELEGLRFWRK